MMRFVLIAILFLIGCNNLDTSNTSYPITRDTLNKFPDKIVIEGRIVEVGNSGVPCVNNRMGCQTIKLKLLNDVQQYEEKYVYIAVPCMTKQEEELLDKELKTELIKIPLENAWACFQGKPTLLNSEGIPFYQPTVDYVQLDFH